MTRHVLIYPGSPIIEIPGDSKKITVMVRNVSEIKLTKLRFGVKCDVVNISVSPRTVDVLIPGDRTAFEMTLTRKRKKDTQRYPFALTLEAGGLPVPAGLDLMVDMGPPMDKGWIDVGQVTLINKKQSKTVYYLLAGAPLVLLIGWLLWRASRPKSRSKKGKRRS